MADLRREATSGSRFFKARMVEAAGPSTLATLGPIVKLLLDGDNDEDGAR
ncbi:hypothetical protein Esi_1737_0001 [Ectocarpus siliculosus]|uniref:Uncharacterized protein n=1 Tax=Ectocarpus siliculosus TaxID=2880 RepID=D7FN37_ECTSI|nr:hypothetical protein Esi_1737_0001 [Ectocarpus siliculosus]|eukprot:CBJ34251.1 hypothetical protein Esi_1737_0001 [Ectocarpus siliculosus]